MNNKFLFSVCMVITLCIAVGIFTQNQSIATTGEQDEYRTKAVSIFEAKCIKCHTGVANVFTGHKFDISDLVKGKTNTLKPEVFSRLVNVVNNNLMPPASYVKKHPNMALTPSEKQVLLKWAELNAPQATQNPST